MFNRTIIAPQAPSGPTHVTVNEHKAPTDDAVRLHEEMLTKARGEVVSVIAGEFNNTLSHATVEMARDFVHMKLQCFVVFRLNGVDHKIKFKVEDGPRDALISAIVRELGISIGNNLFS